MKRGERASIPTTPVREATPTEADDATDFVTQGLRDPLGTLRESVGAREQAVASELEAALDDSHDETESVVTVVTETAFQHSLARFIHAYNPTRPTSAGPGCVATVSAPGVEGLIKTSIVGPDLGP